MDIVFWLYVLLPVGLAISMNAVIFLNKWTRNNANNPVRALLPPGWVIGAVWTVLFALMGYCAWLLRAHSFAHYAVLGFILWSLIYPLITAAGPAFIIDKVSLIFAFTVACAISWTNSRNALAVFLPLLLWVSYIGVVE